MSDRESIVLANKRPETICEWKASSFSKVKSEFEPRALDDSVRPELANRHASVVWPSRRRGDAAMRDSRFRQRHASAKLALLGRFALRIDGTTLVVPEASAKALAAIALHHRPIPRAVLAELLWPQRAPDRARANLRSVIWRIPPGARELVRETGNCLELDSEVEVDVDRVVDRCRNLAEASMDPGNWSAVHIEAVRWGFADEDLLVDLLPTWDDDWVLVDRARLRHLRLHALEALAELLVRSGRVGEAVDAAAAALRHEPLRESAAVALVSAHLASGNLVQAQRTFVEYRETLHREMGLEPTNRLTALVASSQPFGVSQTTTG